MSTQRPSGSQVATDAVREAASIGDVIGATSSSLPEPERREGVGERLRTRILPVQRRHQGHPLGVRAVVHGVQVGQQAAQPQRGGHRVAVLGAERPGLLAHERARRGVQPVDRRERPELEPARHEFLVADAVHVPADVVAPHQP